MRTETKRPMSFDEQVTNKLNQTEREMKAKKDTETMKTVLVKVKKPPLKATLRNRKQMLDQAEEDAGTK
jgi:hypothetical protein